MMRRNPRTFLPHPTEMAPEEILTHLAARLDKSGECWEWTGSRIASGYGTVVMGGESFYVHRLMLATVSGLPDGMFACHHCDNPPCANPDHLYAGTAKQNSDDMHRRGRWQANPLRGEAHPRAHPEALVLAARNLYAEGELTKQQVADRLGLSFATVDGWTKGEVRGHEPLRVRDGRFVASTATCGSRAGWFRHRRAGDRPCELCQEANRIYMRNWKRARRAQEAS